MYLAPVGELDVDGGTAFDQVLDAVDDGVTVVVCDMQRVPFLDVCGLRSLVTLAEYLEDRGVALFFFNWQDEPLRLVDLIDELDRPYGGSSSTRPAATAALRRGLGAQTRAGRARGARTARGGGVPAGAVADLRRRQSRFRSPG
ncbi:STAS domain-containing protein [Streptomyces sp. RerS4]|nr:STAS domain-containing protein [Streptomyces sp. RerS4]UQW99501.1 STAS domain-containing protein [Streptomyces sp. RerS4]